MLKLIIEDDEGRKTVVPFVRDEITIGRQEGNTIRLTERNVSRRHARLLRQNGHVLIEDLGSYNGIRINGDRIAGQVQINDGDLIQIGDYDLAIQAEDVAQTSPIEPRTSSPRLVPDASAGGTLPALPMVGAEPPSGLDGLLGTDELSEGVTDPTPPSLAARAQSTAVIRADQVETNRKRQVLDLDPAEAPRLVVLNTELAGKEFPCVRTELKIGRTDDNDLAIDHRSLSRTHAKVVREDDGEWRVIDLQSANGLMVNGEPYAQVTLRLGDIVELGHVKLQFVGPHDTPMPSTLTSVTQETRRTPSRAPVLAAAAAAVVLVVGVGGYALIKALSSEPAPAPPPLDVKPAQQPQGGPGTADVRSLLDDANTAIAALDWDRARALLNKAEGDDGQPVPAARALLSQLDAEVGNRNALQEAARALDDGELEKARTLLDAARQTQLLAPRLAELEQRRQKLFNERMRKGTPAAPAIPKARLDEADQLFEEAKASLEKRPDSSVAKLERCVKVVPTYAKCFKLLGSAYSRIYSRDKSDDDFKRAAEAYLKFLELAEADDPAVPKVKAILREAGVEVPQPSEGPQ